MLSKSTRGPRLALALFLAMLGIGFHSHAAYAQEDDDEEEEEEEAEEEEEEEAPEADEGQPPVTAGGLYTLDTYPQGEISRPLTMTQKITQLRLSVGADLSAKGAFKSGGFSVEAVHGLQDNFSLIGGFTSAYNFKQFGVYAGFEAALAYDLVNFRMAANLYRNAIPNFSNFCSPEVSGDPEPPDDPEPTDPMTQCGAADPVLVNLPNGKYDAGDIRFSIDIGFPFRYAIRPEIAIVALQTLMSIDFLDVETDYVISETIDDGMGGKRTQNKPTGNKRTPDLRPSLGIATNPIPQISLYLFGQLRIPDFDTSAGAFQIPVTGRLQFSPNQKFDIGLEFTLLNVKPPADQSPIDNRYLSLFIQSRLGK